MQEMAIILTIVASVQAWLAAGIYSWICCRTKPLTWPLVGLTGLLYAFAVTTLVRVYMHVHDFCETSRVHWYGLISMPFLIIGYTLFLIGTFRTGPVKNHDMQFPPPPSD